MSPNFHPSLSCSRSSSREKRWRAIRARAIRSGQGRSFGESYETGFLPRLAVAYAINDQMTLFSGFAAIEHNPARMKPFTELRLRHFVKATIPVPGMERVYLAAYEELFFDLDDTA